MPLPVTRYLRTVLKDGQPLVEAVYLEHSGTFNMGEADRHWKRFASTQRVIIQPPGFDWDARIMIARGLPVRVHDAYIGGEGLLDGALFGCVRLACMRGAGAIAEGELMRFLAESLLVSHRPVAQRLPALGGGGRSLSQGYTRRWAEHRQSVVLFQ